MTTLGILHFAYQQAVAWQAVRVVLTLCPIYSFSSI